MRLTATLAAVAAFALAGAAAAQSQSAPPAAPAAGDDGRAYTAQQTPAPSHADPAPGDDAQPDATQHAGHNGCASGAASDCGDEPKRKKRAHRPAPVNSKAMGRVLN
jgi:hypothetical protein